LLTYPILNQGKQNFPALKRPNFRDVAQIDITRRTYVHV